MKHLVSYISRTTDHRFATGEGGVMLEVPLTFSSLDHIAHDERLQENLG